MNADLLWDEKSMSDVKLLAHRAFGIACALRDLSLAASADPTSVEALFDQLEDLGRTGSMAAAWSRP